MKVAAVIMSHDSGMESRGDSFEYVNVYLALRDLLGEENVLLFDFMDELRKSGKQAMNEKLRLFIRIEKPDVTLFCLHENEFDVKTFIEIKEETKTVVYFLDDPLRPTFAKQWIKHFDYFATSDYYMFKQYESEEIKNVIYTPFGFSLAVYKKKELDKKYDVSFVGSFSPLRKWLIELLAKEGVKVNVFGSGWGVGEHLPVEGIVDVYNQSKINLNLTNGTSRDIGMLLNSFRSLSAIKLNLLTKRIKEQVRGKHFAINGCGGFQLSYFVPGLNLFYEIDKEIAVYEDIYNLPAEIKFFLNNEDLRTDIANAGYIRSLEDHSSQKYLSLMLNRITEG